MRCMAHTRVLFPLQRSARCAPNAHHPIYIDEFRPNGMCCVIFEIGI
jgi:hypothetical protein